jgi:hypothetical protein
VKRYLESLLGAVVATLLSSFYGQAAVLYSNGPSTYNDAASNITGSDYVADSFSLAAGSNVTSIYFVTWNSLTTINWGIASSITPTVTIVDSGTSALSPSDLGSPVSPNSFGYHIFANTIATNFSLAAGTYYLILGGGVGGSTAYWDVNNGPSTDYLGTSQTGPFSLYSGSECNSTVPGTTCSNTFEMDGTATPIPATLPLGQC